MAYADLQSFIRDLDARGREVSPMTPPDCPVCQAPRSTTWVEHWDERFMECSCCSKLWAVQKGGVVKELVPDPPDGRR